MVKKATLIKRNVKPAFEHDCSACKFLGRLDGQDLYHCPKDGAWVRRFGDDGPEYGSLGDAAPPGTAYAFAAQIVARRLPPNAYATQS